MDFRGSCHNPLTFQCLIFPLQVLIIKGKLLLFSCDPLAGCLQCLGKWQSRNVTMHTQLMITSQYIKHLYYIVLYKTLKTHNNTKVS